MTEEKQSDKPKYVTNKEFATRDFNFVAACEAAGVDPTKRQASKWRRKEGKAWKAIYVGGSK